MRATTAKTIHVTPSHATTAARAQCRSRWQGGLLPGSAPVQQDSTGTHAELKSAAQVPANMMASATGRQEARGIRAPAHLAGKDLTAPRISMSAQLKMEVRNAERVQRLPLHLTARCARLRLRSVGRGKTLS